MLLEGFHNMALVLFNLEMMNRYVIENELALYFISDHSWYRLYRAHKGFD